MQRNSVLGIYVVSFNFPSSKLALVHVVAHVLCLYEWESKTETDRQHIQECATFIFQTQYIYCDVSFLVSCLKCGLKKNQSVSFQQQFIVFARIYISFFFTAQNTFRQHRETLWGCIHRFPSGSHCARLLARESTLNTIIILIMNKEKKNYLFVYFFWLFLKCLCVSLRWCNDSLNPGEKQKKKKRKVLCNSKTFTKEFQRSHHSCCSR